MFHFKNKLTSPESSVIGLCPSIYDSAKSLTTKGVTNLHLLLAHGGYLPRAGA